MGDKQVVVIGAGGHAHVVVDILQSASRAGHGLRPNALLDDDPVRHGGEVEGVRVLGTLAQLDSLEYDGVVIAIGQNSVREAVFTQFVSEAVPIISAIHPSAIVASSADLGDGVMLCAGVVINPMTQIADNVILNTQSSIDHHNVVGAHSHIAPGARLGGGCTVGEGALVGLGANVLPGRRIGRNATVGAGAVVTRDVNDEECVVGNPAAPLK